MEFRSGPTPFYGFGIFLRFGASHGSDFSFFFQANILKREFVISYEVPNREYMEFLRKHAV